MNQQRIHRQLIPPVPPNFAKVFIDDGWRGVERHYGARTALLLKWIEECGGEDLHQKRRENLRQRRCGKAEDS